MAIDKKDWFMLDEKTVYLTHGTFGGCLKTAFDNRIKWHKKIESDPFDFINNHAFNDLEHSRKFLSDYLNCSYQDLVYFPNPSTALNAVIKSINLSHNDEVLTTNHEYGSLDRTWRYYSSLKGYTYKSINIDIPYNNKQIFIDSFLNKITDKTKIIYLSHITSSTGLIFPVKEICEIARNHNIISFVYGAHASGQIPVDISEINPDIYVGACHKWMCSPKGVSFLYAKKTIQNSIDPLVISWGWESDNPGQSQFIDYHQYQGTNDISSYLTIPSIINFFQKNNWINIQEKCHELIINFLNDYKDKIIPCSNNQNHIAQMLSFKINSNSKLVRDVLNNPNEILMAQNKIFDYNKIRIPIIVWNQEIFMRISIQAHNKPQDLEKMLEMIKYFNLFE